MFTVSYIKVRIIAVFDVAGRTHIKALASRIISDSARATVKYGTQVEDDHREKKRDP
jgi:hypothetical protein